MAKLDRSFQLLGVAKEGCTVEQIRGAYIDLVKQYHPDSKGPDASAETFAKVCGLDKHDTLWCSDVQSFPSHFVDQRCIQEVHELC